MDTPFPNQPPPFEGTNLFDADRALRERVEREHPAELAGLREWGRVLGQAETFALADAANRHPPQLRTHDRRGERVDAVEFHPAWHELMTLATNAGEHCAPWQREGATSHVARAMRYYLHAQVENGTQCPVTMTYACMPVLRNHGHGLPARSTWIDALLAPGYDARTLPIAQKRAALVGMGMTERQGGSDVRSNRSACTWSADGSARLDGHKWFFSAPQCDAHLVLAQAHEGITCFFVPRLLDDGSRNGIRINRLKDKLGNRSNASSEVEFEAAWAWPLGPRGRGVATILEMVQHTRLDCVIGSAGMMRGALAWALHHARHRVAFGRLLIDQPLMRNVLADLALEIEAALALALRIARCLDAEPGGRDRELARIAIPAAKYWVCKRAPATIVEAMEVLGGNGYVEENPLPRLYREAPVNSIWEGSGNVIALDVARARRDEGVIDALLEDLASVRGADARLDRAISNQESTLNADVEPAAARSVAQNLAVTLAAAELVRHAPGFVADAFCASRLGGSWLDGAAFGNLHPGPSVDALVERSES